MKVLWVGPLADSEQVTRCPAVSAAAVSWQRSMIEACSELGCHVQSLSYITESSFPKGSLIPESSKFNLTSVQSTPVQYINITGVREYSLLKNFKSALRNYSPADVVITYNERPAHTLLAQYLRKYRKSYWVTIVADANYVSGADLYVFLSYEYYKSAKVKNKIHIDGGINPIEIPDFKIAVTNKPKILLFNGSLTKWTGIERFALDFAQIDSSDFVLKITGQGKSDIITKLAEENQNIIFLGFLNDYDLDMERRNAFAFVNPRPVNIRMGETNFPSKILEYLSYCKPILSTKSPGLAPYYDNLLFYYDENSISSLERSLKNLFCLSMDDESFVSFREKLKNFGEYHAWKKQVIKILDKYKSA
jgi:glycosyltransferase involved in cell wall biosynthesis